MKLTTEVELPGGPDVELVARTLYNYNRYGGQPPPDVQREWPPKLRTTLMHYWKLATHVVEAQRRNLEQTSPDAS